ncbi:MAG: ferrous iron transporter B, partial [Clostridia bacterium]|nr:ferrous iron transporter B [Clostridia bacterium]
GERDRKMTIMLTPFMSCSAKIPIYAMFSAAFFPDHAALCMIALYVTGIVVGILVALVFKTTRFRGKPIPFVMELPNYRMPSPTSVLRLMWEKARDFIQRAFTIIFVSTIVIWFLQTFDIRFNVVADSADSILANIGRLLAPVFAPLGFSDWRAATALITGITAKEAVVSTLEVLLGGGALSSLFPTVLSAAAFLVFTLLYTPCFAAIAAVRRETGSIKSTVALVALQCGVAWLCGMLVYQIGGLLF